MEGAMTLYVHYIPDFVHFHVRGQVLRPYACVERTRRVEWALIGIIPHTMFLEGTGEEIASPATIAVRVDHPLSLCNTTLRLDQPKKEENERSPRSWHVESAVWCTTHAQITHVILKRIM